MIQVLPGMYYVYCYLVPYSSVGTADVIHVKREWHVCEYINGFIFEIITGHF